MLQEFLTDVVGQIVVITFFVLSMIMVLEYLNVFSKGHVHGFMQRNSGFQILIASFLGVVPGCIGSYTAVSLYTHNVIGFGALLANLIATTGDEAFLMMSKNLGWMVGSPPDARQGDVDFWWFDGAFCSGWIFSKLLCIKAFQSLRSGGAFCVARCSRPSSS